MKGLDKYTLGGAKKGNIKPAWMSPRQCKRKGDDPHFPRSTGFPGRWVKPLKPEKHSSPLPGELQIVRSLPD